MKKILGLDLGTNSIGWALINEAENNSEKSSIIKLGVRINSSTEEELSNFGKGNSITKNANRTIKRSMRRNLQRYKLRREKLLKILKEHSIITAESKLLETGNKTTFETYQLRRKAVNEKISLEEFSRVLLMINKKRGYKSNRKVKQQEDGKLIDGMEVAKILHNENLTPGQLALRVLQEGKKEPDFYPSDLQAEFDKIWNFQKQFYPEILMDKLYEEIKGKNKKQTWDILKKPFSIDEINQKENSVKKEIYSWRAESLTKKQDLEVLAIVLQKINSNLNSSSGYLGAISDRSKNLYMNKQTVGQYLMDQLDKDPKTPLKNKVFYRQDYLDEFDKIWDRQAEYHKELTAKLRQEIRDYIIFYQRRLKSQKRLISLCEFERKERKIDGKNKLIGQRVIPRSSPLFQEFKVWQRLNDIKVYGNGQKRKNSLPKFFSETDKYERELSLEEKELLAIELSVRQKMTKKEVLKLFFENYRELDLNFENIDGNQTQADLFGAYKRIIEESGHEIDLKKSSKEIINSVNEIFSEIGIDTNILHFDSDKALDEQPMYKLWHLLYSFESDNSKTGYEKLINKLIQLYGFEKEQADILANVSFKNDYGSLSARAIHRILPFLKKGDKYDLSCKYAGYKHSKSSLTKEEIKNKSLKNKLDILPKNSLRNPIVEGILNQMVNVVNAIIDTYGKPDEIRIELARELKKNAKERQNITEANNKNAKKREGIRERLQKAFSISNPSQNDITRYQLYEELESNGYKTLYSDTYISQEDLFSGKKFDIDHIIPQSRLFDDSFSNKTLELKSINIEKGNDTAFDFVKTRYDEKIYLEKIEKLSKSSNGIGKSKLRKLKMSESEIPKDFIERDISDTQYIAKKAKSILEELVFKVVSTTGSITKRLREDWQLIDIMRELNWEKYDKLGLTEIEEKEGHRRLNIKNWTKRNDHRHHAMDALTVAFTKNAYIQYLNNVNARYNKNSKVYAIEQKYLQKGKIISPINPLTEFRTESKKHLENILISFKSKNKIFTVNINTSKKKGGSNRIKQLTPRGQLHNETIYGSCKQLEDKKKKVDISFNEAQIAKVCNPIYRKALLKRLQANSNDPKKAFTGKNSLSKNPIFLNEFHSRQVPEAVQIMTITYTIRKEVSSDLNIDKVKDDGIKKILKNRLEEFGGDPKKAFSKLDGNPIWLNKEKRISIKKVTTFFAKSNVKLESLHEKKDKNGNLHPIDFVATGNNHHVAIYLDADGKLREKVMSFFEAVTRVNMNLPAIDKNYKFSEGWKFLFSMKKNEHFIFPNEKTGFNPNEIDLLDPDNYCAISSHLYRVQKISTRDYCFRHHLETNVEWNSALKDTAWIICGLNGIDNIVKVRINCIGQIVSTGEY